MDFGPNSDFVPHSPLSYSNSYAPATAAAGTTSPVRNSSRTPQQQQGQAFDTNSSGNKSRFADILQQQWQQQQPNSQRNRPILKQRNNNGGGGSCGTLTACQSEKKPSSSSQQQPLARKDSLKTVAFGLTTNLNDTCMAKDGTKTTARAGVGQGQMKMVIFSHEAHALHKLVTAQREEIDELKRSLNDYRAEARDQMDIIAGLSSRLFELEQQQQHQHPLMNSNNGGTKRGEKAGKVPAGGSKQDEEVVELLEPEHVEDIGQDGKENAENLPMEKPTKKRQKSVEKPRKQQEEERQAVVARVRHDSSAQQQQKPREEFLQRLAQAMQAIPRFEERLHTVYRLWALEDSASPGQRLALGTSGGFGHNEESSSCAGAGGPTSEMHMVRRTITQQEEVRFISASPSRYRQAQAVPATQPHQRNVRTQPIIEPFEDEEEEDEVEVLNATTGRGTAGEHAGLGGGGHHRRRPHNRQQHGLETMANVRRSEQCTDDADFFRQQQDEEEDQFEDEEEEEEDGRGRRVIGAVHRRHQQPQHWEQHQQRHHFANRTLPAEHYPQQQHHQVHAHANVHHQHQHSPAPPHFANTNTRRRQQREADSTVRNRYK